MWFEDLLWGFWNGLTAWIVLIIHIFGGEYPIYNSAKDGTWYAFGFLVGVGSNIRIILSGPRKVESWCLDHVYNNQTFFDQRLMTTRRL